MPSSTLTKFQDFAEQVLRAKHDFGSHTLKAVLTNTLPTVGNTILADITQIAATGGYVAGGYVLDSVVLSEAGGVAKLTIADEVITAAAGSIGPFRYVVLYNDTQTSPADALIGWLDYGAAITLAEGESLTLDFDGTNGVLTLT